MNESFPGRRGMPVYGLCLELHNGIFPRARQRIVGLAFAFASRRPGTQMRLQKPEVLLERLKGLRSDRQLERYLAERVLVKDLASLAYVSVMYLKEFAEQHVDSQRFQYARQLLGRRPNRLRYLRAALEFWR